MDGWRALRYFPARRIAEITPITGRDRILARGVGEGGGSRSRLRTRGREGSGGAPRVVADARAIRGGSDGGRRPRSSTVGRPNWSLRDAHRSKTCWFHH